MLKHVLLISMEDVYSNEINNYYKKIKYNNGSNRKTFNCLVGRLELETLACIFLLNSKKKKKKGCIYKDKTGRNSNEIEFFC